MKLQDVTQTAQAVGATRARRKKTAHIVELLRRARPEEVPLAVSYLAGQIRQGKIGVGPSLVRQVLAASESARESTLELRDVDAALDAIAQVAGAGALAQREEILGKVFSRATTEEREFLSGLLLGELRQGALEGIMLDAIAAAADVAPDAVRRALMLTGELTRVADIAMREGRPGLSRLSLQLFRPLKPMLAQTTDAVGDVLADHEPVAFEYKFDGTRIQVHRLGDDVKIFTRRLNDVTDVMPEVVEAVRALPARELVLDGEALAFTPDGRPHPFQVTMSRVGRADASEVIEELPLRPFFFDVLQVDGEPLLDEGAARRWEALEDVVPDEQRVPRLLTDDTDEASRFLATALRAGHEGVMAKALDAPYEAGRRGGSWRKIKPSHTLDLVILAAEWGNGRRTGYLSNLHLGARDADTGQFVMLGKTFKGLTDEMLAWQTKKFLEIEAGREKHIVYVRPEVVAEVTFDTVQTSPRYPAGMALRFARIKQYRPDKDPAEADTLETVRRIHRGELLPPLEG